MANGEPKPTESKDPKKLDRPDAELIQVHRMIGQILMLQKVQYAPGLLIDGDLEVVYSADLKGKVKDRIKTKLALVAGLIEKLQDNG